MMQKKVLVTGFNPFDSEPINPSFEAVRSLPDEIGEAAICKVELPTEFGRSALTMAQAIEEHRPDVILMVGQSGGSTSIRVERVAINIDDARIPDNAGKQPTDEPIIEGDAVAYFSTLPIKNIVAELSQNGIPAVISETAGTFVCNHVMYWVLSHIQKHKLPIQAGFIHVPYIPEQTKHQPSRPSMHLSMITQALGIATRVCLG